MIILRLLATLLFSASIHIDRFLVTKTYKESSAKSLMVFSTLVAGTITLPLTLIFTNFTFDVNFLAIGFSFLAAACDIAGTFFYLKALEIKDTTLTTAMLQLIPVFSFLIGLIFFGRALKILQIVGALIIITSAVAMTINSKQIKSEKYNWKFLLLMLGSTLMYAVHYEFFSLAIAQSNYATVTNLYQIGLIAIGIFLWFRRSYREQFIDIVKVNGRLFLGVNMLNELITAGAGLLANYVAMFISITIVNVLGGFQPAFVLILGLIGAKIWPKIFDDKLSRSEAIKSSICIVAILFGLYIMLK